MPIKRNIYYDAASMSSCRGITFFYNINVFPIVVHVEVCSYLYVYTCLSRKCITCQTAEHLHSHSYSTTPGLRFELNHFCCERLHLSLYH